MLPQDNIAGAEGYQSEGLLIPLMQRTVGSTSTDLNITDSPDIWLLKAVQEGLSKELPLLQTRLWALNEACVRIQVGLHDALVDKFRQASQHRYDRMDTSPLGNVSEDVMYVAAQLHDESVLFKAVDVLKQVFKK
jgi:hypothetical protein